MIKNYLKAALRSLRRNSQYTTLHIIGLGVAIACGLFIYRYITFHNSYDSYHERAPQTYKLVSDILLENTAYNEGASESDCIAHGELASHTGGSSEPC